MTEAFNSDDILISAANILYSPLGTALPDETDIEWNDFDEWPVGWVHVGYTATPARTSYTYDVFELFVEQSTSPVKQKKTNERAITDIAMSQFSADNLALLLDGTITETGAGATQKGFKRIVTGGATNLAEYQFALEGYRADSEGVEQPVRIFFYRGTIRINGSIEFAKAAGTTLPAQITALADPAKTLGAQLMEVQIVLEGVTA